MAFCFASPSFSPFDSELDLHGLQRTAPCFQKIICDEGREVLEKPKWHLRVFCLQILCLTVWFPNTAMQMAGMQMELAPKKEERKIKEDI